MKRILFLACLFFITCSNKTDNSLAIKSNPKNRIPFDKFIGINGFIDDPIELLQVAGIIREYHSWSWNDRPIYKNGKAQVKPFPENKLIFNVFGGKWNFDAFYAELNEKEIEIVPCLMKSVGWLNKNYGKPVSPGKSTINPHSYLEHADYIYQYVARYASNSSIPKEFLKVRQDIKQSITSGLNYIKYFENWNEPNMWWKGSHWEFSPEEFSCMLSADYDGHMSSMGNNIGLKNADPNAKLVMGGIANLNLEYIKKMKIWSDENRNGSIPFDVLNLHHYSYSKNIIGRERSGISPEDDLLYDKLQKIVNYRNKEMKGKEIWITEFGYDTNPNSPQSAKKIGRFSILEVQGQWIIRSFLIIAASGIDRAFLYMLRDVDGSDQKYSTSGITGPKNDWTPKPAWYYLQTTKSILAGTTFMEQVESLNKNVVIYKFKHISNPTFVYVIWCKTSKDYEVKDYQLEIENEFQVLKITKLKNDTKNGENLSIQNTNCNLNIDINESPIFVTFQKK